MSQGRFMILHAGGQRVQLITIQLKGVNAGVFTQRAQKALAQGMKWPAGTLTLGGLVGFVTLFGISVRNSIMLVSHYRHLVEVEGQLWNLQTVRRGAAERLVPILMTALLTTLGLAALALISGAPGNEIEGPLAAVILGGLLTSTLLKLPVLPMLAGRWLDFSHLDDASARDAASLDIRFPGVRPATPPNRATDPACLHPRRSRCADAAAGAAAIHGSIRGCTGRAGARPACLLSAAD